jgi:hypothetical protein
MAAYRMAIRRPVQGFTSLGLCDVGVTGHLLVLRAQPMVGEVGIGVGRPEWWLRPPRIWEWASADIAQLIGSWA